jgi:hypothetical protein
VKLRRVESSRISDASDDTGLVSRFCFVFTPHSALIAPFPLVPCQLPAASCQLPFTVLVSQVPVPSFRIPHSAFRISLPPASCLLPAIFRLLVSPFLLVPFRWYPLLDPSTN